MKKSNFYFLKGLVQEIGIDTVIERLATLQSCDLYKITEPRKTAFNKINDLKRFEAIAIRNNFRNEEVVPDSLHELRADFSNDRFCGYLNVVDGDTTKEKWFALAFDEVPKGVVEFEYTA